MGRTQISVRYHSVRQGIRVRSHVAKGEAMETLVLVAYATRYGSTADTAQKLAEFLRRDGIQAEVRPVGQVTDLKPYAAVMLAAALYIGRLHKDARRFLVTWREELMRIPVALLVPGPVELRDEQFKSAEQQLDKELARVPWLHPVARKVVGGKWDPAKLPFPFKWTLRHVPASDARDLDAIRAWVHEIVGILQAVLMR
jgi:menaquinone-dependent protoporphyrinogen oxidase